MVAGAVLARLARRLAAVDAQRLMQRDTRPPVLCLRSFGDDALKLWTATFGRPSLLERFTPRRFDAFEEVIARHFAAAGPVIAVNPPGTRLAPLGAARETLDPTDWQSMISEWMSRSAAIVFIMPPGQVTGGLAWELQQVSANRHWAKTLIIVPPVRASLLHARWQRVPGCLRRGLAVQHAAAGDAKPAHADLPQRQVDRHRRRSARRVDIRRGHQGGAQRPSAARGGDSRWTGLVQYSVIPYSGTR